TQEEENDNNQPWALDDGQVGTERKLYYRELIARYGHHLALNWNLGEENTQNQSQQQAMAAYFWNHDPYQHNVVIHTDPSDIDFSDRIYNGLLGDQSVLTGASLQMRFSRVHRETLKWLTRSRDNNRKWVVANDEQNPFQTGVPPDLGWEGFDGNASPTQDEVRKFTLWGNLMAGGSGVEYYFGYDLAQNDLNCEDWRSRDQMWDYNRHALDFFRYNKIPFWDMVNRNDLVDNLDNNNDAYCLAQSGSVYLVYLPQGGSQELDLESQNNGFQVFWYNPRQGGSIIQGNTKRVIGPGKVNLGLPPYDPNQDWLAIVIDPNLAPTMIRNEKSGSGASLAFKNLSLYPNPAQDKVILEYVDSEPASSRPIIRVYDQRGQLMYQEILEDSKNDYNQIILTNHFSPGLYFVVFQVGNQQIRKRLLIH
ncbi:MAG: T9SS type A sorting domain-containing protein, partial [Bacteroidota bacterium]